jgi:hypothetical protein
LTPVRTADVDGCVQWATNADLPSLGLVSAVARRMYSYIAAKRAGDGDWLDALQQFAARVPLEDAANTAFLEEGLRRRGPEFLE